jgi:hypothetical protein
MGKGKGKRKEIEIEKFYYIFTYWIFIWYLFYISKLVNINPKFALIMAIIENICILFLMFYYKTNLNLVFLYIIMMIILKIIPLYSIWNTKIGNKDIIWTFILFIIYLIFRFVNNKTIDDLIQQHKDLIIYNKNVLPGINLFKSTFEKSTFKKG